MIVGLVFDGARSRVMVQLFRGIGLQENLVYSRLLCDGDVTSWRSLFVVIDLQREVLSLEAGPLCTHEPEKGSKFSESKRNLQDRSFISVTDSLTPLTGEQDLIR